MTKAINPMLEKGQAAEWMQLVDELASDLEAELRARYTGLLDYPTPRRHFDRDMEPVNRARALLAANPDYSGGRKPHQPVPGIYSEHQHARNMGEL